MGGAAIGLGVASLLASAGSAAYSAHEQSKAQKQAEKVQAEAVKQQEELLLKKGPEAVQTAGGAADESKRKNLLRAGVFGNIKTSRYGLSGAANTAGVSLAGTGRKTALGA